MSLSRRSAAAVLLGTLCACGGGAGGSLADLTGTWLLTPSVSGTEDDPLHFTLLQVGTSVRAERTCDASWPAGTGTWDGVVFALSFDFGGGDVLALTGAASGAGLAGSFTSSGSSGTFVLDRTSLVLDCAHACDPVTPPRFVEADFADLSKMHEISLFRSSAGHDYSDGCEDCRSMKHYFAPFVRHLVNGDVVVKSPVAGEIVSITNEGHGASVGLENKQVRIRSSLHPEVTFILFHVDLAASLAAGDPVAAGDLIGTGRLVYPDLAEVAHDIDVAVRVHTPFGERYVSWFDVLTDALFATYMARGAASRSDFVLTQAQRDADPLSCTGETFTSTGALPVWFVLSGS